MSLKSSSFRTLLLAIFALSGFAGLIYQSIWAHYLGLFLGHAAYSQALVLSLFMGGMALGAALVARFGGNWSNLIKAYALAEAAIGILGIAFHPVFVNFLDISYEHVLPALSGTSAVSAYKWGAAGLLILPQTILLGMTFPLLSGGLIRQIPDEDGRNLGSLYFANSIGAAAGILVATFAFLPLMGLPGAMLTGGILNLLVALAAWRLGKTEQRPARPPKTDAADSRFVKSPIVRLVLLATFFSSAASFAYELVFVRILSLAVGSTLHAFELMIAAFVLGIALGARWIRKRAGATEAPLKLAGHLQIWMGISALVGLALYSSAFSWVGFLMESLARTSGGYSLFNVGTGITAIAIMLPTAFFAGTTLPVFTVTLLRQGFGEASIGRVYAWNTLGAIVGVTATIHFLLPALGIKLAMLSAALVDILIGVALFRFSVERRTDFIRVGAGAGALVGAAMVTVFVIVLDPLKLSSGVYRSGKSSLGDNADILYYKDGKTATVTLFDTPDGVRRITTNGKVDAGVNMNPNGKPTSDEPTMILLGALPLAYKPNAKNAAVIGVGSGITTHILLGDPEIDRVDTIEIERAMAEAARGFGSHSNRTFDDPRSNLIIDDAKSYFAGRDGEYDLIVSEPSNPWMSGVGNLFSEEFYELVPRVLKGDGVFVQWLQLYEIDTRLVNSALGAMLPQFDHVHAYLSNSADLLLVASNGALPEPDFEGLLDSEIAPELTRIGISRPRQIAYRKVADRRLLQTIVKAIPTPINSDYFPILSLEAPRTRFERLTARWITSLPLLETGMLEWLGIREPINDPDWPEDGWYFPGESAAARALSIRAFLGNSGSASLYDPESASLESLHEDDRNLALRLGAAATILCNASALDEELAIAFQALSDLSARALPHLAENLLDGLLIGPNWLSCTPDHPPTASAFLLLESLAQRDAAEMVAQGRAWLENHEQRPEYAAPIDKFAFASLQFGLVRLERFQEAIEAENRYGQRVAGSGGFGMSRILLQAWIDATAQKRQ